MIQTFRSLKPVLLCIAILAGLAVQSFDAKTDRTLTGKACPEIMETVIG